MLGRNILPKGRNILVKGRNISSKGRNISSARKEHFAKRKEHYIKRKEHCIKRKEHCRKTKLPRKNLFLSSEILKICLWKILFFSKKFFYKTCCLFYLFRVVISCGRSVIASVYFPYNTFLVYIYGGRKRHYFIKHWQCF